MQKLKDKSLNKLDNKKPILVLPKHPAKKTEKENLFFLTNYLNKTQIFFQYFVNKKPPNSIYTKFM